MSQRGPTAQPPERCEDCGFDGFQWTDEEAIAAVAELPAGWRRAIEGLDPDIARRRPVAKVWSIAEYTDHVRETVFGMRFILDVALAEPGTDLGEPPEPSFDPEAGAVDLDAAVVAFEHEIRELCERVRQTPAESWRSSVIVGGDLVDVHWIIRHALHDVTHHIGDVHRLRAAQR